MSQQHTIPLTHNKLGGSFIRCQDFFLDIFVGLVRLFSYNEYTVNYAETTN